MNSLKKHYFLLVFLAFINIKLFAYESDLTLIGYIMTGDGIGQIIPNILFSLKNDLKIKFIPTRITNLKDLDPSILKYAKNPSTLKKDKVILHTWLDSLNLVKKNNNQLNLAYVMCETTKIPNSQAQILNKNFDAIIVPDDFLIDVFKNSGVKIPIFVLPIILNLKKLLHLPSKNQPNKIFTFGCTAAFWERKNHLLLVKAFNKEFGNNPKVKLVLQGRFGEMFDKLRNFIFKNRISNIEITQKLLNEEEYLKTLKSFDCFVLISKGEGFSIPPREALALGIPCIISNNTSHITICNSGFVKSIKCDIIKSADNGLKSKQPGFNFDCKINDICDALAEVYRNYNYYLTKAKQGKNWVLQYLPENLQKKYLNIIKPKKILFGSKNLITNDFIMTNSFKFYKKYKIIFK